LREPDFDAACRVSRQHSGSLGGVPIERLCAVDPDLDAGRLGQWCQATAVVIAVQHLYRRPPDATTKFLLRLAASA